MFGDDTNKKMAADILDKKNLTSSTFLQHLQVKGSSIAVDILFKQGSAKIR